MVHLNLKRGRPCSCLASGTTGQRWPDSGSVDMGLFNPHWQAEQRLLRVCIESLRHALTEIVIQGFVTACRASTLTRLSKVVLLVASLPVC